MTPTPFVLHRLRRPESWLRRARTVSLLAGLDGIRAVEVGRCGGVARARGAMDAARTGFAAEVAAGEAALAPLWRPAPPSPWPVAGPALAARRPRLCALSEVAWDAGRRELVLRDAAKDEPLRLDAGYWEVPRDLVEAWLDDVAWLRVVPCPVCGQPDARTARADKLRFAAVACHGCRAALTSAVDGEGGRALELVALGPDEPCGLRYRDGGARYALREPTGGAYVARLGARRALVHEGRFGGVVVRLEG